MTTASCAGALQPGPPWRHKGAIAAERFTVRKQSQSSSNTERDAGFTLLELLVVIAILGLLAALVGPRLFNILTGAKGSLAKQQIENIGSSLDLYKLDVGSYPTTDQGLAALVTKPSDVETWNGPYTKTGGVPQDPWNHPWMYRNPASREGHDYDLCSGGASGQPPEPGQGDAICNK
jgi:general secretion pathway protein G